MRGRREERIIGREGMRKKKDGWEGSEGETKRVRGKREERRKGREGMRKKEGKWGKEVEEKERE